MPDIAIDPKRTALLSLDFHGRIVNASPMGKERVANTRKAMEAARKAGVTVIHVGVHPRPDFTSERNKFLRTVRQRLMAEAQESAEDFTKIVEEVGPIGDEPVVVKPRISAFYNTELDTLLRSRDIDTLVIAGMVTEFVVDSTVRHATDADYRIIILEDCCGGFTVDAHKNALAVLDRMADIVSSQDFIKSIA